MKLKWARLPRFRLEYLDYACLAAGFLMLGYGCWLIYRPAAFIVCGALLISAGLPLGERRHE